MRARLLIAILVVGAAAGLAAGIVLARGDAASKGNPGVLARGAFHAVSWGTTGNATIVREASGKLTLRLSRHFRTQRAPELYVYLARYAAGRRVEWKLVGALARPSGRQQLDLPASAGRDLRSSVAIFCAKCGKIWGEAPLAPV
jgi:hypothetical protein